MPKRGENIYKRKDNRWEGRYYAMQPDGSRKQLSVYASSYAAVKEKLLICREQAARSRAHLPQCRLTFADVLQTWLAGRENCIKLSSYQHYLNIINTHLLPVWGKCLLNKLTAKNLSGFISQKRQYLAAKTVADILAVVKSAVKMALKEYNLPNAAMILELKAPAGRRKAIETFNENEIKILSEKIWRNQQPINVAVMLALNCGLRLGEVCALQWSDIDFVGQTLSIKRNVQRLTLAGRSQLLVQTPKSDCSVRTIPLTAEILLLLQNLPKPHGEFVFNGRKPLEPRTLQYRFAALLQSCGIRRRNFHTLRHTFASRYIEIGADVKSLSEILGHAGVNITMQLYVHPSLQQKRINMERINSLRNFYA